MLRLSLLAAASLAVIAAAAPALAQDADQPVAVGTLRVEGEADADFSIQPPKDDGYRADRIVSATRTEAELRDVPQAITVVTRDEMADRAVESLAEAVLYTPGVSFAQGEGNRDAAVFRGNSTTADFFVDGLRDDVQYFRDLYNVERLEVLKGPNAMIFGRGGAGGVINRVSRAAGWDPARELHLEAGSEDHYRAAFDLGQGVSDQVALRLAGMWQDSGSFRDHVTLERWGLNPTASFKPSDQLLITVGYEHFEDERTADRGVPGIVGTFGAPGGPVAVDRSTFFGNPDLSFATIDVDALTAAVEYRFDNGLILRNRTRFADYDKVYQNVFPSGLNAAATLATITAYNDAYARETFINQTDLNYYFDTGSVSHTLLAGLEFGRQDTDNLRRVGNFGGPASILVPVSDSTIFAAVTFGAPTVNNASTVEFAAVFLQDQIQLTDTLQLIAGLRYDDFRVEHRNNLTSARTDIDDGLLSPRLGLIWRPIEPVSLYASYTKTYLPRNGEQLTSLSNISFDPEEFDNYEVGLKWDARPELTITAALYRLDRSNVVVPHPTLPGEFIEVDGQRTEGLELSATGRLTERWSMVASYAWQDGEITRTQSATVPAGAKLANLPEHSFGLWNRYDFTGRFGAGVGVIYQSERFAATDNRVELPDFWRVDAAAFYDVTDRMRVQLNLENIFDEDYFVNAHNNFNLSPGAGRLFRAGLTFRY
jgi:catecholate siderophore receptor